MFSAWKVSEIKAKFIFNNIYIYVILKDLALLGKIISFRISSLILDRKIS